MSHQGNCTAVVVLAITLLMTLNSLSSVSARPTIHTVGDDSGWTFNVERWTRGKRFQAGDILGNLGKSIFFNCFFSYSHSSNIASTSCHLFVFCYVQLSTMIHHSTMLQLLVSTATQVALLLLRILGLTLVETIE